MAWFWKRRIRTPGFRREPVVRFIGEQDGAPERRLKAEVSNILFRHGDATRAYLARVEYGNHAGIEVALCIRGKDNPQLVRSVAVCFQKTFNVKEHLDVLFLSDSQEAEVDRVCAPFYAQPFSGANPPPEPINR